MTQSEVVKAEKAAPLKRTQTALVFRDKELAYRRKYCLNSRMASSMTSLMWPIRRRNPELAFLTWCLELTKRYGEGVVYLNKKPVGRPGVMLDERLKQFWKQTDGEILVVYEPEGITNVGVGITLKDRSPIVELDYAATPREKPDQ